jgi:Putative outer membrane beta-barrel porin, MtrB/PioB
MKRVLIVAGVALALAAPVLAQTPSPSPTPTPTPAPATEPRVDAILAPDFKSVDVTVGAIQRSNDTGSSKFFEYRDIPNGGVLPHLNFAGKSGDLRWEFDARDVTQKDQTYFLNANKDGRAIHASYVGIPHSFGNSGLSLLSPVGENEWRLSDTVQQAYQNAVVAVPSNGQIDYNCQPRFGFTPSPTCFSLLALVTPGLNAAPANIDLKLQRGRGNVDLNLMPKDSNLNLDVSYFHERRTGYRAANGTSFGFGNVVETPEPVRYITQDFGVNAALKGDWGVARAAVHFNDFQNKYDNFIFDNPFRVTDSWDSGAYSAPATSTRNGASYGKTSLYPDNKTTTETAGATIKLGAQTRLTADLTLGQWTQDKDPLIPWTTNTSVPITLNGVSTGQLAYTAPLPATALDGKANTTAFNGFVTTRLGPLGLNARYRHYNFDNQTPRYEMNGYVRFDAVWEELPRITVPYGYTNDYFDTYATFGTGIFGLEAGWKYNKMKRTFRESDDTSENTFRVAADVRSGIIVFRGIGEFGSRDYSNYELATSEDASFQNPGPPANQTVLRRPDQAKRDLVRVGGQVELSPGDGKFNVFAAYLHTQFKYDQDPVECQDVEDFPGQSVFCPGGEQKPLGMIHDKYDTLTFEASFAPSSKLNLYAFYTWEDGDILQNGRQSGSTVNFATNDVFSTSIVSKGNTFGAGADWTLVPDRWLAKLFVRYQKIDGNNDITLLPGFSTSIYGSNPDLSSCTSPGGACSIPEFDDTKLTYVFASLGYRFAKQWLASVGVGFEDYEIRDSQTGNTLNYMPASFFL